MEAHLCWAGHVVRMSDEKLPCALLCGELCNGVRSVGVPKKPFKDLLKSSQTKCGILDFEVLAQNRSQWKTAIKSSVTKFEQWWAKDLKECRHCRKERISAPGGYTCDRCPKVCGSAFGVVSHRRPHSCKGERRSSSLVEHGSVTHNSQTKHSVFWVIFISDEVPPN